MTPIRAKISRELCFMALTVMAMIAATALTPAANAAIGPFAFKPGAFAKAHVPLQQEAPPECFMFQCVIFDPSEAANWIQAIEDAPEPTQAGGHPDFSSHFRFEVTGGPGEPGEPPEPAFAAGHPKSIITDAPAGAIGNPLAIPRCEQAQFNLTVFGACPPASQVGLALTAASIGFGDEAFKFLGPVSSLVPAPGEPALLGFKPFFFTALLRPEIRSESDYGLRINVDDVPMPLAEYTGSTVTLWGVPHDAVHDPQRFNDSGEIGGHVEGEPRPFLSGPTNCSTGPITVTQKMTPWEHPGLWAETSSTAPEPTGCDRVPFEPSISARPTTPVADSASGLEVDIATPQHEGCEAIEPSPPPNEPQSDCGLATSHLKDTTVTLPAGFSINPSAANGLDGCTIEEIGLTTPQGAVPQHFTKEAPRCPASSRIGSVEVDTPLLEAPMPGSIYIAKPYDNPFGSLLAIYIVADDEERGVIVKLAGEVHADPVTGQLSTTVTDAPQLPFAHFLLHFKQGPHATLRTPAACGQYTTDAALTPYSAPTTPFERQDTWSISQGPSGSCAEPNAPSLDAGSVSPLAGASTPTVVKLSRADGTQEFSTIKLTLPPGLTGKLAGVDYCPDSALAAAAAKSGKEEQASPSCPGNSQIGKVYIAAGAGPSPYNTTAAAYLTGPYKGAPVSMAIVTPALAGPFDLGTVVVRVALRIDQNTGQITAQSDPLPRILKGIPLDIRSTKIVIDRPGFTRNGTSCDASAFSGEEVSTLGQSAPLADRYQLAECSSLGFKPKLAIRLFGGTKRRGHPALRATLQLRPGEAGIAAATFTLPPGELLDLHHLRNLCAHGVPPQICPAAARLGRARLQSPFLIRALEGPIYWREPSDRLPGLVADLHGSGIHMILHGHTATPRGRLRFGFSALPDLPLTKAVLVLRGGRRGIIVNSESLCTGIRRAEVALSSQGGKSRLLHPRLRLRRRC